MADQNTVTDDELISDVALKATPDRPIKVSDLPPSNDELTGTSEVPERKYSIYAADERPQLLDVAAGGTPAETAKISTPAAVTQLAGKDIATIPAAFFNQMFFNAPRSITETFTPYKYPSEQDMTGSVFKPISYAAGITGAVVSPITKAILGPTEQVAELASAPLRQKMLEGAVKGTEFGLAQSPQNFLSPEQRLSSAAGGAILGAAIPAGVALGSKIASSIGKMGSNTGRFLAEYAARLDTRTLDTIDRLGLKRVFDTAKASTDYMTDNLIPRAKEAIRKQLLSGGKKAAFVAEKMGWSPEQIDNLKKIPKEDLSKYLIPKDVKTEYELIQGIQTEKSAISDLMSDVFKNAAQKGEGVIPKKTYYQLRSILRSRGLVDQRGGLTQVADTIQDSTMRSLVGIYKTMTGDVTGDLGFVTGKLNIGQYTNYLDNIEAAKGANASTNRFVYQIAKTFRQEATKQISNYGKISLRSLYDRWSILSNLEDLTSKLYKVGDDAAIEQLLTGIEGSSKLAKKEVFSKILSSNIIDDLDAYRARQAFDKNPGGGGVIGGVSKGIARQGIKVGKSITESVGGSTEKINKSISNISKTLYEQPAFSAETKQAVNKLGETIKKAGPKGKGGFASVGKADESKHLEYLKNILETTDIKDKSYLDKVTKEITDLTRKINAKKGGK